LGFCISAIAAEKLISKVDCITWESGQCLSKIETTGTSLDFMMWFSLGATISIFIARIIYKALDVNK
jgi:hypothetical protein